jgi:hypothetical protein
VDRDEFGRHAGHTSGAMTKHEVAAELVSAGHTAGFCVIPEFETRCPSGKLRKIDIVWARRERITPGKVWTPVAAFEIEGHDVAGDSIAKNADSLCAASQAGARVVAMVLFRIHSDGIRPKGQRALNKTEAMLRGCCRDGGLPSSVEVLLDESLRERLPIWVQNLTSS